MTSSFRPIARKTARPTLAVGLLVASVLAGCASVAGLTGQDTRNVVRPGAFAGGPSDAPIPRPDPADGPEVVDGPALVATPTGRPARALTLRADPGLPGAPVARPVSGAELIDAKVGDISGRPVYANEFFEPMEARLKAEAKRLPRGSWVRLAKNEIDRNVQLIVTDELLRAEALANLTSQQRQGLRAFLEGVRNDLISRNAGSAELAERRLRAEEGKGLDEIVQDQEKTALVQTAIIQEINRGVNVSWRDIEQRYERDHDIYNPAPTARFVLIRVPTDDTAGVGQVTEALASGKPFAEIASGVPNTFKPDEGGVYEERFEDEFAEHEFFGADELNQAAWGLSPGEWTGPFEFGSQTGWLMLESVKSDSISLYEAQLDIERELLLERRQRKLDEYINLLVEQARVGDLEDLKGRLLDIATERYAPAE